MKIKQTIVICAKFTFYSFKSLRKLGFVSSLAAGILDARFEFLFLLLFIAFVPSLSISRYTISVSVLFSFSIGIWPFSDIDFEARNTLSQNFISCLQFVGLLRTFI